MPTELPHHVDTEALLGGGVDRLGNRGMPDAMWSDVDAGSGAEVPNDAVRSRFAPVLVCQADACNSVECQMRRLHVYFAAVISRRICLGRQRHVPVRRYERHLPVLFE